MTCYSHMLVTMALGLPHYIPTIIYYIYVLVVIVYIYNIIFYNIDPGKPAAEVSQT